MASPDTQTPDAKTPDPQTLDTQTPDAKTEARTESRQIPRERPLRDTLRWSWRQLTSMRTALLLLFVAALAAIPGSIVPQRSVNPVRVSDFIAQRPRLGAIYEAIGMFDVYSSVWFSAIYLLLLVSLIGCIIPRVLVYAKAMRQPLSLTPRNLARLPEHRSAAVDQGQAGLLDRAESELRRRRFKVVRRADSVSAERGYLREAGNLVFHLSLLVVLAGVAIGSLAGYKGSAVVVVGQGFSNNLTQYDDITAGGRFTSTSLRPFSLTVDSFDAQFETGPVQTGAARVFSAALSVVDQPGAAPREVTLEVNQPLTVGGTTVHLIGHGYAPRMTVRDGSGNVAFSGPVPFLPQDGNFSSAGAIKAVDARPDRLAFQGFFLPTAVVDDQGPRSIFPDAINPEVFLNAWYGPPKVETGRPENVYSLDVTGLTQAKTKDGETVRFRLKPGEVFELPEGRGSITMDGWDRWVKLQVAHQPGLVLTLIGVGFAVAGLCFSLFIRPRRLWVRATPADTGEGCVIEVAGLDRADARTGLDDEVGQVYDLLVLPPAERA